MTTVREPINVLDFEAVARSRMDPASYDYYAGGAEDERTVAENRAAFDRVRFRPRVLVDVSHIDVSTSLLGTELSLPVLLAPTAFNRLAHEDGEVGAARAAGAAGTVMVVSTMASTSIEDIAAAAEGALWFQLYVYRDRGLTADLIQRAEAAGFRALVLTVDAPRLGRRERDTRNRFSLPDHVAARNFERYGWPEGGRWSSDSSFFDYVHANWDATLTWDVLDWLRSLTSLPIVVKGILSGADARRAASSGAAAVIVSNHGGRQLDGAIATIDALPAVVQAAGDAIPVLLDGGVRRGTDVLKALALGAQAVLIGRPYLWGLAAAGEDGVRHVLDILRDELQLAMALAGAPSLSAIKPSLITRS